MICERLLGGEFSASNPTFLVQLESLYDERSLHAFLFRLQL